jgi:hypothetical protein
MARVTPVEEGGYERELEELGMSHGALLEAVGRSNTERRLCPVDSTRTALGFYAYNGMVAGLTSQLRPFDYRRIDLGGVLPLWVNDELKIKLGVTSGNAMTGIRVPMQQPGTRYPKGELVRQMVQRNQPAGVFPLFDIAMEVDTDSNPLADYDLWLALMYFDKAKSEMRYEISYPSEIDARGIIKGWTRRIIPPPYLIEEFPEEDPNEGFGDIDVPVEPR